MELGVQRRQLVEAAVGGGPPTACDHVAQVGELPRGAALGGGLATRPSSGPRTSNNSRARRASMVATLAPRAWFDDDEALDRQHMQGVADRVARNVEVGRELLLDEAIARLVVAADDGRA